MVVPNRLRLGHWWWQDAILIPSGRGQRHSVKAGGERETGRLIKTCKDGQKEKEVK